MQQQHNSYRICGWRGVTVQLQYQKTHKTGFPKVGPNECFLQTNPIFICANGNKRWTRYCLETICLRLCLETLPTPPPPQGTKISDILFFLQEFCLAQT